jgi:hypothetical protein
MSHSTPEEKCTERRQITGKTRPAETYSPKNQQNHYADKLRESTAAKRASFRNFPFDAPFPISEIVKPTTLDASSLLRLDTEFCKSAYDSWDNVDFWYPSPISSDKSSGSREICSSGDDQMSSRPKS